MAAVLIAVILPGTSAARVGSRPDLKVSAGSVRVANGKLKGSFVVRNNGKAKSAKSLAGLIVRAAGKKLRVKSFPLPALDPSAT